MLWMGVYRLWTGYITYGTMNLFLQLSGSLSGIFSSLVGLVPSAIAATTAAGRIMEIVELPRKKVKDEDLVDRIAVTSDDNGVSVEIGNLNFKYANSEKVVM